MTKLLCGLSLLATLCLASTASAKQPTPVDALPAVESPVGAPVETLDPAAVPRTLIPTLAYNHYHPEAPSGLIPARLYLCPRYNVPAFVGHTYITYPAFAPHELMWLHSRGYYRIHPDGAYTITTIHWEHR